MNINAQGRHYRELNEQIRAAADSGDKDIVVENVRGQRYIAAGLDSGLRITINGVPGNDLGAFMNGAEIIVHGNAQDGVANTMNAGRIVVHGNAGDVLGHSMRGGKIFVRGSVGYRAGIHMKAYQDHFPIVVIGGTARDYLGEYMAGGILAVLNMGAGPESPVGEYVGTGMHGGAIYLRGRLEPYQAGAEVMISKLEEADWSSLSAALAEFCQCFGIELSQFSSEQFIKLTPRTARPYGDLYAY
jgi:glutamate synthase domain-containing protein 3